MLKRTRHRHLTLAAVKIAIFGGVPCLLAKMVVSLYSREQSRIWQPLIPLSKGIRA